MNYLIPANSKKSLKILGVFDLFDLILFISGIGISLLLLLLISPSSLWGALIDVAPALICGFLVFPIPNYHNIRTVIINVYEFYTRREKFIWKGWCVKDEYGEKK